MGEKTQLDYRLLLGECEIRESQAKAENSSLQELLFFKDATIAEQAERISSLEATVAKAFLRCQELEEALRPFADAFSMDIPVKAGAWRHAFYVLCHVDPVPGCETSSAEGQEC